ncbi:hypothetical protein HDG70_000064 [Carboxydothermus ferrireducens DSM 11255]|uniref:Uncharacterized protein n=1 Tax=Carboxydothermus ferrireducens DSM 11255 TaxID=1119529 RepID=A0ABX2R5C3_9THEO|nr:hypothetical protein [Carboxydothermus ferrireducens DSM 11255]
MQVLRGPAAVTGEPIKPLLFAGRFYQRAMTRKPEDLPKGGALAVRRYRFKRG